MGLGLAEIRSLRYGRAGSGGSGGRTIRPNGPQALLSLVTGPLRGGRLPGGMPFSGGGVVATRANLSAI